MIRLFSDLEGNYVIEALDLGRAELGKTIKYKMFMKNTDPVWSINNIKVESVNQELKFEFPESLKANQVQEIFVYWTPKLDSRKPLSSEFKFTGEVFIG